MAYSVRGRSSSVFGPSVYHGCSSLPILSLTFDDGPSERTPEILSVLAAHRISCSFFQCGANILRLPQIAQAVSSSGHEIGNHSHTHPKLYFRSPGTILSEFQRTQRTAEDVHGLSPKLMRAPFGVRWFGFRAMQSQLNLLGVMWTVIGRDWKLSAEEIAARLVAGAKNGAIFCLHDGHELNPCTPHSPTAEALRIAIPQLLDRGYHFKTVSNLLCPKN